MKNEKQYFIIDLNINRPMYGYKGNSLVFSSHEAATELAMQLFETKDKYVVIEIPDFFERKV